MKEELIRDSGVPESPGTFVENGVERMEVDGQVYDIVPPSPDQGLDSLTPEQSLAAFELYKVMARMLPVEGRDYVLRITFPGEATSPSLSFSARTELGEIWIEYLRKHLPEEIRKQGEMQ